MSSSNDQPPQLPCSADVVLVSMPFGPLFLPSIGLGLLKAAIAGRGVGVKDFYFTLSLAERIGTRLYLEISNGIHSTYDLLGEWIFSRSLFGPDEIREKQYVDEVLRGGSPAHRRYDRYGTPVIGLTPEKIGHVVSLRDQEAFLDQCMDEILECRPRIVGFTSVFQQQLASLALAKRLKSRVPELIIIMGGANCEGAMGFEVVQQFPFVDAVVSGEGDQVVPDLIEALLAGRSTAHLKGVYTQERVRATLIAGQHLSAPSVQEMDQLPIPDYSGFFDQLERSRPRLSEYYTPHVLFETSRGCYWGKVAHCTFCGLNGANMAFRSKSAGRAMDELLQLTREHPGCPVTVVDNILDMQYFQTFIPEIKARKLPLELFYEVKANLKKEQVRMLRDAGIRTIQPGIESLSSPILQQMQKGCTRLQNIQLLKWCKEFGVCAIWNILWGFPGESAAEYQEMADLVPSLVHLDPPQVVSPLRLDRFSPYFDRSKEYGFCNVLPYPSYSYVYHLSPEAVANLAYYSTFEYAKPQDPMTYTGALRAATEDWREHNAGSDLFSVDLESCLFIWDLRHDASTTPVHALAGVERELYLACDRIRGISSLQKLGIPSERLHEIVDRLVAQRLMLRDGDSVLSIAVPLGEYRPSNTIRHRFSKLVREIGCRHGERWVIETGEPLAAGNAVVRNANGAVALTPQHFDLSSEGRLLVDLENLDRVDLNLLRARLGSL